jgi:hypothetical protein
MLIDMNGQFTIRKDFMRKYFSFYKILGLMLIICSIFGYFTIADDFRHTGEFIGVSSVLVSGIIFLLVENKLTIFKNFSLQWLAIFILLSIPLGGVLLDKMFLGISIGIVLGILFAYILGTKQRIKNTKKD